MVSNSNSSHLIMKTIKYILTVFFVTLVCSCTEPIEFDAGEISPYVVLLSRPSSDSTVCVYISKSRFFLDNSLSNTIDDATVTLYLNGVAHSGTFDPGAYNGYGAYVFTACPNAGDTLRVSARVPGFPDEVTSTTVIPQLPGIEILDYVVDTGMGRGYHDEYGGYYYGDECYYKVRFKINSLTNNEFYKVRFLRPEEMFNGGTYYWDTVLPFPIWFYVNDPIVNVSDLESALDGDDGSFSGYELLFGNELFSGNSHEFTAIINQWPTGADINYYYMPIYLEISSLSRELYRYIQTSKGYYSDFDELFGEPIQVFCNIKNGIGIFGRYACKRITMPPPRFDHFEHVNENDYKK